ncbi:MAG TPA: GntR family transcriptional regulator [Solirubrobacteraceae bacterium]|jgi:GntR family transcriptional regulator|nr:GntR family transcriptional regulator [Solirubrobacteraceae bacterium]
MSLLFHNTNGEVAGLAEVPISGMFTELENTPLAERARKAILEAILSGSFENDRLPSEDDLSKMLNVSRTTIRTALHSLEQDGIVTRRRAIGTTINRHVGPSTLALQRLVGFDWLLEEKGHKVSVDQSWRRTSPPKDFVDVLGVDPAEEYFLTEKLYYADAALAIYVRDLIPWHLLEREPPENPAASLFEFSKRHCSTAIDHAVADIVPLVKHDKRSTKLAVKQGQPFIRLHEIHYSQPGDPIAYSVIDVDDNYIRFEVFRRR